MTKVIISSVAIVTIGVIEALALIKGINGAFLMLALTFIGGIAGFTFSKKI